MVAHFLQPRYLPQIPYIAWAAVIAGIMTVLNLAGMKSSAHANKVFYTLGVPGAGILSVTALVSSNDCHCT